MLINAVVLQKAKDSSEIENIITTQDELYRALATTGKQAIHKSAGGVTPSDYRQKIKE